MTVPSRTRPAPGWLQDLAAARARYEELLGWPVRLDLAERRLAIPVGTLLDAIIMRAGLGERVLGELAMAMLAGPVTAGPGCGEWTFLTQPAGSPRRDLPAELVHLRLHVAPLGVPVVIPTHPDGPGDSDSDAWWVQPPRPHRPLPPWPAVLGATRRVAARLAERI